MDLATEERIETLREEFGDPVFVSADTGQGLEELRERTGESLALIRVYLKPRSGEPDFEEPLVLPKNSTVGEAARRVHRDMFEGFRWARVWGPSAKHEGQQVGLDHVLQDGDVLTIVD